MKKYILTIFAVMMAIPSYAQYTWICDTKTDEMTDIEETTCMAKGKNYSLIVQPSATDSTEMLLSIHCPHIIESGFKDQIKVMFRVAQEEAFYLDCEVTGRMNDVITVWCGKNSPKTQKIIQAFENGERLIVRYPAFVEGEQTHTFNFTNKLKY